MTMETIIIPKIEGSVMMKVRSLRFQAAVVAVLVGVMLILLGGGGAERREPSHPVKTLRPPTAEEQRQWEVERLSECLRDLDWCHRSGMGVESR